MKNKGLSIILSLLLAISLTFNMVQAIHTASLPKPPVYYLYSIDFGLVKDKDSLLAMEDTIKDIVSILGKNTFDIKPALDTIERVGTNIYIVQGWFWDTELYAAVNSKGVGYGESISVIPFSDRLTLERTYIDRYYKVDKTMIEKVYPDKYTALQGLGLG